MAGNGVKGVGWIRCTPDYLSALSALRDAVNRELDAVQVGAPSMRDFRTAIGDADFFRVMYRTEQALVARRSEEA